MSEDSQDQDYDSNSINDKESDTESEVEKNEEEVEGVEDVEDVELDEGEDEELNEEELSKDKKSKQSQSKTFKSINFIDEDEDDDDESDEYENYLKKFDDNIIRNYLVKFHPETRTPNHIEIQTLSKVIRNEDGNIVDDLHKTIPFLTKYEKTRVLGQRAKQIESGAKPFVKVPSNIIDSYVIAQMELKEKKIPFIIRRPLPNGASEYWKLTDLQIIN